MTVPSDQFCSRNCDHETAAVVTVEDGTIRFETQGDVIPDDVVARSSLLRDVLASTSDNSSFNLPISIRAARIWVEAALLASSTLAMSGKKLAAVLEAADVMIDNKTIQEVCKANKERVYCAAHNYDFPAAAVAVAAVDARETAPTPQAAGQTEKQSWVGKLLLCWTRHATVATEDGTGSSQLFSTVQAAPAKAASVPEATGTRAPPGCSVPQSTAVQISCPSCPHRTGTQSTPAGAENGLLELGSTASSPDGAVHIQLQPIAAAHTACPTASPSSPRCRSARGPTRSLKSQAMVSCIEGAGPSSPLAGVEERRKPGRSGGGASGFDDSAIEVEDPAAYELPQLPKLTKESTGCKPEEPGHVGEEGRLFEEDPAAWLDEVLAIVSDEVAIQVLIGGCAGAASSSRLGATPGTSSGIRSTPRSNTGPAFLRPGSHTNATKPWQRSKQHPGSAANRSASARSTPSAADGMTVPVEIMIMRVPGDCFDPRLTRFLQAASAVTVSVQLPQRARHIAAQRSAAQAAFAQRSTAQRAAAQRTAQTNAAGLCTVPVQAAAETLFERAYAIQAAAYFDELFSGITALPHLRTLCVRGVLGSNLKHLSRHLPAAKHVTRLEVAVTFRERDGVGYVAASFMRGVCDHEMASLDTLVLRCRGLCEAGGAALAQNLCRLEKLQRVELMDEYLEQCTKTALEQAVAGRTGVTLQFLSGRDYVRG